MSVPLRLRGITGYVKGKVWASESLLRVGRLGSLEVVLDNTSVSRRHAEVRVLADGWWVRDLGSTNGTYVNGERLVHGERQLRDGDIVQFGNVRMMVVILEKLELPELPQVNSEPAHFMPRFAAAEAAAHPPPGGNRTTLDMNNPDLPRAEKIALKVLNMTVEEAAGELLSDYLCVVAVALEGIRAERERLAQWVVDDTHTLICRDTARTLQVRIRRMGI